MQQCLDMPELQAELICALIKQTSKSVPLPKLGVQVPTQKLLKKGVSGLFYFQFLSYVWYGFAFVLFISNVIIMYFKNVHFKSSFMF